jgi:hypothetical protein
MVRCLTCGGTYEPTTADGMQYFHACPPLGLSELRDALRDNTVQLSRVDRQRLRAAREADQAEPMPADQPTREALVLETLVVERPNKRDENIRPDVSDREKGSRIKAEGLGVEEIVDV